MGRSEAQYGWPESVMTAPDHGSGGDEAWFAPLSSVARAVTSGDVSEYLNVAGRHRLLANFGSCFERRQAQAGPVAWRGAGVITAGAAAAHLLHIQATFPEAEDRALGNSYVSGGSTASPTVRFAGGSSVKFAAGSRGRVGDLRATKARVVLEGGSATVHNTGYPRQDVLVEAGPYALKSEGGAFDVSWSGEVLEVKVASGAVVVEEPAGSRSPPLHEDQAFVARESEGEVRCF
jgi:ferric-dicitrate binding protein FerR (iron transport regulator)